MFWIYLRVVSHSLLPDEVTEALAVEPDWAHAKGSSRHSEASPRASTTWAREVTGGRQVGHPMDFGHVIVEWGMPFAEALAQLVDRADATVSLVVVQEVRDIDDSQQKGIWLGQDAISWLAAARASLDIDQYIFHACQDT